MARNNNNFNFNIPGAIIFLAYILYWPAGIVLTILRALSKPTSRPAGQASRGEIRETYSKSYQKQQKKRKSSGLFKAFVGCGAGALGLSLLSLLSSFAEHSMMDFLRTGLPATAIAAILFVAAKVVKGIDTRRHRIRTIIGNRESINLAKLAAACDESLKTIRDDVQKMIDDGEFGDSAYIDLGANNFMRTPYATPDEPEAFDYRTVYGDLLKKDKKNDRKSDTAEDTADASTEQMDDGDDYGKIIREIRRLNDEIKDVAVSYRIDRIEAHTKNIFDYVIDHPEAKPQIRTFMNYYLPTTLKLLESYSRIERVGVAGENMKKSKENIENILDLLTVGFEQQVDQLFKNESIDISSDISVLETMMQKDGLSGKNDFDLASLVEQYSRGGAAAQAEPEDE